MAGGLIKTALHGIRSTGANFGDVINVGFAVNDYNNAREQGNSRAVSVSKAAGTFAWGEFFYGGLSHATSRGLAHIGIKGAVGNTVGTLGITIGASVAMVGGQLLAAYGTHSAKTMAQGYANKGKFGSGYFNMTEAGYTMRQRSLNAIRQNGLNTQSVLGNEARTYFRGSV